MHYRSELNIGEAKHVLACFWKRNYFGMNNKAIYEFIVGMDCSQSPIFL